MARLSTCFHRSSAFHPQADSRSKQKNKTIGQILWMYTAKKQGKWLEALPAIKFAINLAVNASTGISPLSGLCPLKIVPLPLHLFLELKS
ncbi:hypothetical protein PCASD_19489 [Puccinia coronata f. sp. avenae]|uniref:Integrase catalytic domain-containing protein n=1 Tax=Puccinia coronata f. sp. avenae TaxID=200324 RepID=A0A2N5UAE5_9BASI|nr:hypothetical protein PCASD_19489 [Puccinia coronata f. sp. avenae]